MSGLLSRAAESSVFEDLRGIYEDRGYTFVAKPRKKDLPDFLGSYRPDAIALKTGRNVAIEIKQSPDPRARRDITDIGRLFDGQPDWKFAVYFSGEIPKQTLDLSHLSAEAIRDHSLTVRRLLHQGERRAAFVLSWALLEAVLHWRDSAARGRPHDPVTVVERLATLGHADPATATALRKLTMARDRIVHGDLELEPENDDVERILAVVEETLRDAPVEIVAP